MRGRVRWELTAAHRTASTLMINPATALCMLRDIEKLEKGDVVVQNAANCTCIQTVLPCRRLLMLSL